MAIRIPTLQQRATLPIQQASAVITSEGQAPIGAAGFSDRAAATFFDNVSAVAFEIGRKRKEVADNDYVHHKMMSLMNEAQEKKIELAREMSNNDPSYSGYAQTFTTYLRNRVNETVEEAPNFEAQSLFKARAQSFIEENSLQASITETMEFSRYSKAQDKEWIRTISKRMYDPQKLTRAQKSTLFKDAGFTNPKIINNSFEATGASDAIHNNNLLLEWIKNVESKANKLYTKNEAEELIRLGRHEAGMGTLTGLIERGHYGIAREILTENVRGTEELLKDLTVAEKDRLMNKIDAGVKLGQKKANHELNSRFNDILAQEKKGEIVDPTVKGQFLSDLYSSLPDKPFDSTNKLLGIKNAETFGAIINATKDVPLEEWGKFVPEFRKAAIQNRNDIAKGLKQAGLPSLAKSLSTGTTGKSLEVQNERELIEALKAKQRLAYSDGAQYVNSIDPNIEVLALNAGDSPEAMDDYARATITKQRALNIPHPTLTTELMRDNWSVKFSNAREGNALVKRVAEFNNHFGDFAPQALGEMVRKGNVTPEFAFIASMGDGNAMGVAATNYTQAKELQSNYIAEFKKEGVQDISDAINSEFDDEFTAYQKAGSASLNQEEIKALRDILLKEGQRYQLQTQVKSMFGSRSPSTSEVKSHLRQFFNRNFVTLEGGSSKVVAPLKNVDPSRVTQMNTFLNASTQNEEYLESLNPQVPQSDIARDEAIFGKGAVPLEETRQRFLKNLTSRATWLLSDDANGFILHTVDPSGSTFAVMNQNGEVIRVPFKDVPSQLPSAQSKQRKYMEKIREGKVGGTSFGLRNLGERQ